MKIWCSHSISKANGMGLKPHFLHEKCQKSCSNTRALTRHTGDAMCSDHDCLASDYGNSPVVGTYNRMRLFARRMRGERSFWGDLLELCTRSLQAHFLWRESSKERTRTLVVWCDLLKKMLNFIGHYYSLEISLVEPQFMNQSHKCFFRLLPLQNLYWFFNVLNHAALKSDYD